MAINPKHSPTKDAAKRLAIVSLAVALAALVGVSFVVGQPPASTQVVAPAETLPAGKPAKIEYTGPYVGVSGCAASACHGDRIPANSTRIWQASYTIWASQDPLGRERLNKSAVKTEQRETDKGLPAPAMLDRHNRAYAVLFEDRSRQIERLLRRLPVGVEPRAYADDRCLACHAASSGAKAADTARIPARILADGVGCELCHGPAEKWVSKHTQIDWLADYHAGKFAPLPGMNDTRNPVKRARACAACHVGSPADASHPLRDVDHDLIAAGHPRLTFEYDAYLNCLPKHWIDEPGRKPGFLTDRESHAEAWLIGQLVTVEAAARLLADRAARVAAEEGDDQPMASAHGRPAAWPEFSEYDCFACHHELQSKTKQAELTSVAQRRSGKKVGTLPWGTWNFSELKLVAKSGLIAEIDPELIAQADRLTTLMEVPIPDAAEVSKLSGSIAAKLKGAADSIELKFHRLTPIEVTQLVALATDSSFEPADWDQSAQRFLTVQSLVDAVKESQAAANQPYPEKLKQVEADLEVLRRALSFPSAKQASSSNAEKQTPVPRWDSPRGFDPSSLRWDVFAPLSGLIAPRASENVKP